MNSPMIATTTTAAASRHGCLRRTTAYVAEPETAWVSAETGAMPVVTGVPPAAGRSRLCRTLWQPLVDGGLRQPLALQPERLQDLGVLAVVDQLVDGEDDDVLELLAEGAVLEHDAVVGREVGGADPHELAGCREHQAVDDLGSGDRDLRAPLTHLEHLLGDPGECHEAEPGPAPADCLERCVQVCLEEGRRLTGHGVPAELRGLLVRARLALRDEQLRARLEVVREREVAPAGRRVEDARP